VHTYTYIPCLVSPAAVENYRAYPRVKPNARLLFHAAAKGIPPTGFSTLAANARSCARLFMGYRVIGAAYVTLTTLYVYNGTQQPLYRPRHRPAATPPRLTQHEPRARRNRLVGLRFAANFTRCAHVARVARLSCARRNYSING